MSRDFAIEAGGAAAAIFAAGLIAIAPASAGPVASGCLVLVVGWIVWRDARDFIIPDGAAIALAALAFGARIASDGATTATALYAAGDGLACGGALWAVREIYYRLRGYDGLGLGDVKLAFGAGMLVGPFGFALALLASCLAGLAVVAVRRGEARTQKLPLGALLAPAAFGVWALGLGDALGYS